MGLPPRALLVVVGLSLALVGAAATGGCGERDEPDAAELQPGRSAPERAPDGEHDPAGSPNLVSGDARAAFEGLLARADGRVGVAVSPLGAGAEPVALGNLPSGRAWSTMKVGVLAALIDRVGGVEELSDPERLAAEAALTRSDNEAALELFARLERLEGGTVGASAAIDELLHAAGDSETMVNTEPSPEGYSPFGQTEWSAAAATRFFAALGAGCLLSAQDTAYVLGLMGEVVAEQRWGLGEAGFAPETELAFKGGWGPEPDGAYLVRQSGIVGTADEGGYAISIIALPTGSDRSFEAGQRLVTAAAEWARAQLRGVPAAGCG